MKKKILALVFVMALFLSGCGSRSNMPFNGLINFHSITVEVPEKFVRDSTQSTEDAWLFEQGWYKKLIIITRTDAAEDVDTSMDEYVEFVEGIEGEAERTTFLEQEAVLSNYTKDEMFCQEVLFCYEDSFYAVALRGGTVEEFEKLLETVQLQ